MSIDREKVLAAAQKLVEKKKYDKAVLEYQKLIQEDPNDARTLLKIGDLQSKMEAYADAVATYERVGKHYASQGFSLKAIAVYKQIREIIAKHLPELEERYGHITPKLAELYQQLGLVSDALAALDEVATRMQRQGKDAEAIDVFRKIVELDPTNPLPHLRLAEALSRDKDVDGAVTEFGVAGAQLAKLGRRDDAIKVFERLLHHKQDSAHARLAAELYLARAQPNDGLQALAKLQVCFQQNPKDLDTLGLLARAFNAIGQANKAVEVQKEMARLAQEQGKVDVFRQLVDKLVKLAPNDEGVKRIVASMQTMAQPPSEAPPKASEPPEDLDFEDAEEEALVTGDVELEDEQPFEMRPSAARELGDDDVQDVEHVDSVSASSGLLVENVEIAEEVNTHAGGADVRAKLARVFADAAALRKQRFFGKAVEVLRGGLALAPRSIELHAALRDVYLEAGQTREAVAQMIELASIQVDSLDGDGAAQTLQDALAIDPDNVRAAEMLRELGYEMVDESAPPPDAQPRYQADLPPMREQYPSYDPDAPLPSYDLEEIGPEAVARHYSDPGVRVGAPNASRIDDIDDPFGGADGGAPLPQFPLDGPPESEAEFDLVPRAELSATRMDDPFGAEPETAAAPGRGPQAPMPELESALEEAEFFASRGLFDDARTILEEQLARLPNHPLVLDRLAELDSQEGSARGGSGARAMPGRAPSSAPTNVDRSFDIAQSLDALDAGDRPSNVTAAGSVGGDEQIDVEAVFAKFKEGVAKQIDVDDGQSHYDLGVAYKEMGLVDDALREFEVAARDAKLECICESMIGTIELERGSLNEAIAAFSRGMHAKVKTPDQEMVLGFELGSAYEAKKMTKEALNAYQRVARRDANYRDVSERIRRLQGGTKTSVRAAAVGADDEFDRAFDDILGGGKLP